MNSDFILKIIGLVGIFLIVYLLIKSDGDTDFNVDFWLLKLHLKHKKRNK
jgi:hypothetical protein